MSSYEKNTGSVYEDDDSSGHMSFERISLSHHSASDDEPADLSPQHTLKFDWGQLMSLIQNGHKFCEPLATHDTVAAPPRARAVTADSDASFGRDIAAKTLLGDKRNEGGDDSWEQAFQNVTRGLFKDSEEHKLAARDPAAEDEERENGEEEEELITTVVLSEYESETESPWVILERLLSAAIILYIAFVCLSRMGLQLEFVFEEA